MSRRPGRTDARPFGLEPADWRFLLPGRPAGRLLWVGAEDRPVPRALATSMDASLARGRSRARDNEAAPDVDGFDVVAIVASRGPLLRTRTNWSVPVLGYLTHQLRRGGQLYLEIDRPGALIRPGRVTRRLEALGYEDVGVYWPVRGFERPDLYLPLDDPRPQHHYLDRLYWRGSLARRIVRLCLHVAVRWARLSLLVPRYVIVARLGPGLTDEAHVVSGLFATISGAWPALTGDQSTPRRSSWVIQSSGAGDDGKLICPVWLSDANAPSAVLKVARETQGNRRIDAETRALAELGTIADHPTIQVPHSIGSRVFAGRAVAAETPVDGRPLNAYLAEHPSSVASMPSTWEAWVDWLADLHSRSSRAASAADLDALLFDPMFNAAIDLALEPGEIEVLERLAIEARALAEQHPLRVGFAHHDLGPTNVFVSDDGRPTAVLDWEAAGVGLPATDLLYFVARLGDGIAATRGPIDGWRFESLFLAPGGLPATTAAGSTARRWLDRYGARIALAREWLPILHVACWTMHARNERLKAPASGEPEGPFRDRLRATLHTFDGDAGGALSEDARVPISDGHQPSSSGDPG